MKPVLIVAMGGAIGSVSRYLFSGVLLHHTVSWKFPLSTFVVNVTGCLIIGILAGIAIKGDFFSAGLRLFLFTGILGGFTTFSAFGLETFYLLKRGEFLIAGGYAIISVIFGLLALWLGFSLIHHRLWLKL